MNDALVGSYAFDGKSLRVVKVVGADRTFYLYAGTQLISEYEDAASNNYNPGTTPGAAPQDSLATKLYQHADHLTTRLTTENDGDLSNQQAHYPYGEIWYESGQANPSVLRKYTSYLREDEASTGRLNYAVFREHSARIGRFHMADPVRGRSSPQGMNGYAYVFSDPINFIDPDGRVPCSARTPPFVSTQPADSFVWWIVNSLFRTDTRPRPCPLDPFEGARPIGEFCGTPPFTPGGQWGGCLGGGLHPPEGGPCSPVIDYDGVIGLDCLHGERSGRSYITFRGYPVTQGIVRNFRLSGRPMHDGFDRFNVERLFVSDDKFWVATFRLKRNRYAESIKWTFTYDCLADGRTYTYTTTDEEDTVVACSRS